MATATELQQTEEKVEKVKPLFQKPIEVIAVAGESGAGKTTFCISVLPGNETLVLDNEGSAKTYAEDYKFEYRNLSDMLVSRYKKKNLNANHKSYTYRPLDRYLLWREMAIELGMTGQYRVCHTDPFSEVEDGLADYVRHNSGDFGYTANQLKGDSGLFWGVVKARLKADMEFIKPLYEVVTLALHMRNKYGGGGKPTGKREPKGKDVVWHEASLFLQLEKPPNEDVPSAIVLKSRLHHMQVVQGEFGPEPRQFAILPPRLPEATPTAIRRYIAQPPDYGNLQPEEIITEKELSDADRLGMELAISENQKDAQEAELNRVEKMQAAVERQTKERQSAPQASDFSSQYAQSEQQKSADRAATFNRITEDQEFAIRKHLPQVFDSPDEFMEILRNEYSCEKIADLSYDQAEDAILNIDRLMQAKISENLEKSGTTSTVDVVKMPGIETTAAGRPMNPEYEPGDGSVTQQQEDLLASLITESGWSEDGQHAYLRQRQAKTFSDLSEPQSEVLIEKLRQKITSFDKESVAKN